MTGGLFGLAGPTLRVGGRGATWRGSALTRSQRSLWVRHTDRQGCLDGSKKGQLQVRSVSQASVEREMKDEMVGAV